MAATSSPKITRLTTPLTGSTLPIQVGGVTIHAQVESDGHIVAILAVGDKVIAQVDGAKVGQVQVGQRQAVFFDDVIQVAGDNSPARSRCACRVVGEVKAEPGT